MKNTRARFFRTNFSNYVLFGSGFMSAAVKQSVKPRYRVDLAGQQADCELNYYRLTRVLVNLENRDCWVFNISQGKTGTRLIAEVTDRAPYTTTITLAQKNGPGDNAAITVPNTTVPRMTPPTLTVCLYHDANMAEVVAWETHRRLRPRYAYPNRHMYQVDEKAQQNRFLSDWLTLCQQQGHLKLDLQSMGLDPA